MKIISTTSLTLSIACFATLICCDQALSQQEFESLTGPIDNSQLYASFQDDVVSVGKFYLQNRGQFIVKGSSGLGIIGLGGASANYWVVYKKASNGSSLGNTSSANWILNSTDRITGAGNITSYLKMDFIIQNNSQLGIIGLNSRNDFEIKHLLVQGTQLGLNGWRYSRNDQVIATANFLGARQSQILIKNNTGLGFIYEDARDNMNTFGFLAFGRRIGPNGFFLNRTDEYLGSGDFTGNGKSEFLIKSSTHIGLIGYGQTSHFTTYVSKPFGERFGNGWRFNSTDEILGIGDFNGDGRSDFIIKSSSHLGIISVDNNNRFYTVTSRLVGNRFEDGDWLLQSDDEISQVGDFNGDGRTDFIIKSRTHIGIISLDEMGEFSTIKSRFRTGLVGSQGYFWGYTDKIFPSADFNGDGRDDILLQKLGLRTGPIKPKYCIVSLLENNIRYYNADNSMECTQQQKDSIALVTNEMIGIDGVDPRGNYIGLAVAKKSWTGKNWYPLDGNRKTLCGRFDRYAPWPGPAIRVASDERDWNIIITPHNRFSYLIDDVLRQEGGDDEDWHRSSGQLSMEVEVTPPSELNDYEAFSYLQGVSRLRQGQDLCVYGPWVKEESHNYRPEIHPSELLWWEGERGKKYMVMVQDGSDRFDETHNFRGEKRGFRPWAAAPLIRQFKIAFNTEVGDDTEVYTLDIGRKKRVSTRNYPRVGKDVKLGRQYGISKDNRMPILVVETEDADPLLGVQFESVCYDSSTNRLSGFIVVKAAIGTRTQQQYGAFLEIILNQETMSISR